jgi:hypothetical protein
MDDDVAPVLTRCFRGHSTPAGKTFCESCGAALEQPARRPADNDVVPAGGGRRRIRFRR